MIILVTSRKFDAITRATVVPNSVTKDEKECSGTQCSHYLLVCQQWMNCIDIMYSAA